MRYMDVIISPNIRNLISTANERQIKKDDIVTIKKLGEGEYVLIYYADEES